MHKIDISEYVSDRIVLLSRSLKGNLGKLSAFSAVARARSVSRAASDTRLSQSALSHLISTLESSLEIKLFRRKSHGLELTDAGVTLFEFSQRLFLDVDSLASRLNGHDPAKASNIRVGTHEILATQIWPKVISDVARCDPGIKISLLSGRVDTLIEMLLHGNLHAAVTVTPKIDSRMMVTPLYSSKLKFYVGERLLGKGKRFRLRDVKSIPVFTDSHAHMRQGLPIPDVLRRIGLKNCEQFEVSSFEAAIRLAEQNLGIAAIPDRSAERKEFAGKIRPISIVDLFDKNLTGFEICLTTLTGPNSEFLHRKLLGYLKDASAT